jgi:sporulation protein YqfC
MDNTSMNSMQAHNLICICFTKGGDVMEKRSSLANMITKCLRMDMETLPLQPILELCGDRRALIENHGGVTEYSPERILVAVRFGAIQITGKELHLCKMGEHQLVIRGQISQIAMERGK